MQNNLFNQTLLKKYAKKFKLTHKQKEIIGEYIGKIENREFKAETKNYINFYEYILKEMLGYSTENIGFDEKVDDGVGRSEFVLKEGNNKFMVVELKGQDTNLDKKQIRKSDTRTPVDQAFGYAIHTGSVEWILLSNYDEFRLYNYHEKTKYISFKASDLADSETLKCFLLVFSKESHLKSDYINKIRQETLVVERKLENEFYKLFNETRLMIIKELEYFNNFDRIKAVHYAQLILNRYMFICFAEDQDLLPSQITIDTINQPIRFKDLRGDEIWHRINGLFRDVRDGNKERKVFPYDGVLFDEDLKMIEIRDLIDDHKFFEDTYQKWKFEEYAISIESLVAPYSNNINPIYKNLLTISSFDFSSDLDVNILGHIFENSIGDLEELKADAKGRRKKEGVFYTPEYITDYICRNTIIPYLSRSGEANTVKALVDEYWGYEIKELDKKVQMIKIVDPACGSGAFLNKAADILLEIHKAIHKQRYKGEQTLRPFFDNISKRREILLNNIYGVDLNEESVEITKLALFLKVSRKDLKLPNLDNNIKCGNSIVDDPEFTDKPFKWEEEFKDIFEIGGFDIVIGNPPWGADLDEKSKKFIEDAYTEIEYQINSYVVFLEKIYYLVKNEGMIGLITPPTWLYMHYFKKIRRFLISKNTFRNVIYLKYHAFEDVTSESSILCYKKGIEDNLNHILNKLAKNKSEFLNKEFSIVRQELWTENLEDGFVFSDEIELFNKFNKNSKRLGNICDLTTGIKPYQKNKGIPKQTREDVSNKAFSSTRKENNEYMPYIVGGNITRYMLNYPLNQWIKYGVWLAEPRTTFDFSKVKIVIRRTSDRIFASLDEDGYLDLNSVHNLINKDNSNLDLRYILCLLNSSLIDYVYKYLVPDDGRVFSEVKIINLEKLPIYSVNSMEQKSFIEKADLMLKLNKDLTEELSSFKGWLQHTFEIEKFSKKLDKYYDLTFDEFLAELKKKKVDVKSRKNYSLLKYEFDESLSTINPLMDEISETDKEIDFMVYDLYGLTDEEIKIIEDNLKT